MAEVRMPKMGDGMAEGTITAWLVKEGDTVSEGDSIAEIETDKANVAIPAEESGLVSKIVVAVGTTVPIGAVIAQIGAVAQSGRNGQAAGAPQDKAERAAQPESVAQDKAAPTSVPPPRGAHIESPETERVKASPLARKMAAAMEVDLAQIRGTGPGGRIVERDISAIAVRERAKADAAATAGREIEPGNMRRAIGRRTQQSVRNAPHFHVTMPIEMDAAVEMLSRLNTDANAPKVSVNDLIVKACAEAIAVRPAVNSKWTEHDTIFQHAEINIGIAVALPDGLVIPVVRDCGSRTLRSISAEARMLIAKTRRGELKPQDYSGGTFTVSNLGMMGVESFSAIINSPESAILAIGAALPEVVPAEDGSFAVRTRMRVTLSADHRVLDGLSAAQFLSELRAKLEMPYALLS